MRNRKIVSGLCLIVIMLNFFSWPQSALGADGSDVVVDGKLETFEGQLLASDLSDIAFPPGRTLVGENLVAEDEIRELKYWEPYGRHLSSIELVRSPYNENYTSNSSEDACREPNAADAGLNTLSECLAWSLNGEIKPYHPRVFKHNDVESNDHNRAPITCTVTNTADSGAGTLRACLAAAVAGDLILFDPAVFPPAAPQTIFLTSELPGILVDNVTVDASNAGVILDGSGLVGDIFGMVIWGAQGVTIKGLQILNFPLGGIIIGGGATQNVIGGDRSIGAGPVGQGNRLSDNYDVGIWLQNTGTSHNTIKGNIIGTNLVGNAAQGNGYAGILIFAGASENIIGGSHSSGVCDGPCNLISGNIVGVHIEGAAVQDNQVLGNFIGTNLQGNSAIPNSFAGIAILDAPDTLIGGDHSSGMCDGPCNLISGNGNHGIFLGGQDASNNLIKGNFIGTNQSGNGAIGNGYAGIVIFDGATQNIIGGSHSPGVCDGPCNLISGNLEGIQLDGAASAGNQVLGNFIGTNPQGTSPNPNKDVGLVILDAPNSLIGGAHSPSVCDGFCNLISGNNYEGIVVTGFAAVGNIFKGNYIGTNIAGDAPLSNNHGLVLASGASDNQVGGSVLGEGNLISGNTNFGIWISHENSTGNHVLGNKIGTSISGLTAVPNYHGILIAGSVGTWVGGPTVGSGNLISGNDSAGILIEDDITAMTGTTITGNKIGTDQTGTSALSNYRGIVLAGGNANLINDNLISGNTDEAIRLNTSSTNQVQGNTIGTDLSGSVAIPNGTGVSICFSASNNVVGGSSPGMGNLISGNTGVGIFIQNDNSISNQVLGNRIGTNPSGTSELPNDYGVLVLGAHNTTIGGADLSTPWVCDGPCNLISGNNSFGIMIQGVSASGLEPPGVVDMDSKVLGNFIGTNLSGISALPNFAGVDLSWQTGGNIIGGSNSLGEGNLISGNQIDGVVIRDPWANDNQVSGNRIGTTPNGNTALPNGSIGIRLYGGASNNVIGGDEAVKGNLVSGNSNAGIGLHDEGTINNQVLNNLIGTNTAGTSAVPNLAGIGLLSQVSGTEVRGNLISGNTIRGVDISESTGNLFSENRIGVAGNGLSPLPNGEDGIVLFSAPQNTFGPGNIMAYNRVGIAIVESESVGNTITRNSIYANTSLQIGFFNTEPLAPAPLLTEWDDVTMTVTGTACFGCIVEVFASPSLVPAGHTYLGTTTALGDGSFSLTIGAGYIYLAATATDAVGTTSEFSDVLQIGEEVHKHLIYLPLILK